MDPIAGKQFAVRVVQQLRDAGFESLWAGGCVRDMLLGHVPSDYDVATNATPDQVRNVFGRRRTIAIGAAFGVVTVIGHRNQGQVEIATFRSEAGYSDGRRPDHVTFSTAEQDALRRDFTINGIFYDPLTDQVIDYVEGRSDLTAKVVRAIRDPFERITEDKLRMLRAVRFAATFDFELEANTRQAVQQQAAEIRIVSAERIAAEMRRMLSHRRRCEAVVLLRECALLQEIIPEAALFDQQHECWSETQSVLRYLHEPSFAISYAALIHCLVDGEDVREVRRISKRWKLSNDEVALTTFVLSNASKIRTARDVPWPTLQRLLIHPHASQLVDYVAALCQARDESNDAVEYCRRKLQLPAEQLNPTPLMNGNDLGELIRPSPLFKKILTAVRDAQLYGHVTTKQEALALASDLIQQAAQEANGS